MKKKVPFSLDYKEKIESGEVSVVTRDDRHVNILKWDAKSKKYPIIGTIIETDREENEYPTCWHPDGTYSLNKNESCADLFLLVEEELTEFEKELDSCVVNIQNSYGDERKKTVRFYANTLLDIARKQLSVELIQLGYEQGKTEALKDMPKWKRHCKREDEYFYLALKGVDWYLCCRGYMINVRELFSKLPKEGEE